jgi:DNA-binding MarR family transcriptional regulator
LVVKSLLDRSLIQMTASTADRRSLSLSLQDEGMEMLRRVAPAAHRAQDRLLAPLPKERRAPFLTSLTMLLDAHGALIDPPPPPK